MILTKLVRTFEIETKFLVVSEQEVNCPYIAVKHISKFPENNNIYARNSISLFEPSKAHLYKCKQKESRRSRSAELIGPI